MKWDDVKKWLNDDENEIEVITLNYYIAFFKDDTGEALIGIFNIVTGVFELFYYKKNIKHKKHLYNILKKLKNKKYNEQELNKIYYKGYLE